MRGRESEKALPQAGRTSSAAPNVVRYGAVRRVSNSNSNASSSARAASGGGGAAGGGYQSVARRLVTECSAALEGQLRAARARWGRWVAPPGSGAGAGASFDQPGSDPASVTDVAAATTTAAAGALRGLLLAPWHRLQSAVQSSFLSSPAWRADFLYYEQNMNPVFGLFFCDPHHPLSFLERLDIEFCVYGWVFFTSALFALTKQNREKQLGEGEQLEEYQATNANKYIASFLLVTAPSMVLRVVLFYIFLCPCIVSVCMF
jgi:hypothetical protein